MTDSRPKVFISYSHKDKDLLVPLNAQLKALEQAGLLDVWEDTRIDAGDKWYPEIEAAMASAAVAVCMVSEYFLSSDFCMKEEVPFLLKRAEEEGMLLIPVLLSDCVWKAHRGLSERQMLPGNGQSIRTHYLENPAAVFSKVAELIFNKLNDPRYQPPKPRLAWPALALDRVDLTRLPETGAALFGRDAQLQLLDTAWDSSQSRSSTPTRVVAFTAHGGVGKSTLVNHWLRDLKRDHFRGATAVFAWSFYSQGAREEGMASADLFVDTALRFFNDPDPTSGSAWDKGERLARIVGSQRALLVLDGLEPLQSSQAFERGKLRDPALQMLLRGLASHAKGLCVITTRESLPDLDGLVGVQVHDLEKIGPEAGRALLRTAHVVGTDMELEELSQRFGLHALTISLLGVYLHEIDPSHGVGKAKELEHLPGAPVDQVLAGFETLLANRAEIELLRFLGLFDRPVDQGCLSALRADPPIPGLTERTALLDDNGWNSLLTRLERLRLVRVQRKHGRDSKNNEYYTVDAHPLLREHFAKQLRDQYPTAWREGHRRLYEYLIASVPYRPDGLDGLQPLYQAVAHGCLAGLHQDACDKVYRDRILRGTNNADGFYSTRKLGAFGADLGAVACFFEQPWRGLFSNLNDGSRAWLLAVAAFDLRALGRLTEALEPQRASRDMYIAQKDWREAAIRASDLSRLELTLGEVAGAMRNADQYMTLADSTEDAFERVNGRATYAYALYQAGQNRKALALFRQAEQMQTERDPRRPLLYNAVGGFRYCDLLLADAERTSWALFLNLIPEDRYLKPELDRCNSVSQRAEKTHPTGKQHNWLLNIALYHFTLGRVALYRAILERSLFTACHGLLDNAVSAFRAAGRQDYLPRGLLTRAWLRVLEGDADGVRADLDEAWQIAERGSMKLHMADIHLYRARLFKDKSELAKARKLIDACGYHRRDGELQDAEEAAKGW